MEYRWLDFRNPGFTPLVIPATVIYYGNDWLQNALWSAVRAGKLVLFLFFPFLFCFCQYELRFWIEKGFASGWNYLTIKDISWVFPTNWFFWPKLFSIFCLMNILYVQVKINDIKLFSTKDPLSLFLLKKYSELHFYQFYSNHAVN